MLAMDARITFGAKKSMETPNSDSTWLIGESCGE